MARDITGLIIEDRIAATGAIAGAAIIVAGTSITTTTLITVTTGIDKHPLKAA